MEALVLFFIIIILICLSGGYGGRTMGGYHKTFPKDFNLKRPNPPPRPPSGPSNREDKHHGIPFDPESVLRPMTEGQTGEQSFNIKRKGFLNVGRKQI